MPCGTASPSPGDSATTPHDAGSTLSAFFDRLRQRARPALDAADRDALINIIMARTGKNRSEAVQVAANYEQSHKQAVAKYN